MLHYIAHQVTRQTPEDLTVIRCAWMGMKEESCPAADLRSGQFSRRPSTVLLKIKRYNANHQARAEEMLPHHKSHWPRISIQITLHTRSQVRQEAVAAHTC